MSNRVSQIIAAIGVLAAIVLALYPPAGIAPESARMLALALGTMVLLATGALPEHVTAISFFAIAMLLHLAPVDVVFSGFQSTALWMVFGGLVIGVGVRRTGLARRIATRLSQRLGASYAGIIFGMVGLGVALAFLMPSTMGRVLILTPIVLALSESFGFGPGSTGRTGMILAMSFGTMIPSFAILPATVPAMVLIGASETLYGVTPVYGEWLLLHFPILGFVKALILASLVVVLFPDRPRPGRMQQQTAAADEGNYRVMAVFLAIALGLWITDFVHHISPAWVALGVAALCVLPWSGLVPPKAFNGEINYGSLFYVAGVLAVGPLVQKSGVVAPAMEQVLGWLDFQTGDHLKAFVSVVGTATLGAPILTQPGVPAVMVPLAGSIADAAGLPVSSILMMIVVGFSTVVMPYQAPPLVVAMQLGGVPMSAGNKLCLLLFALTVVFLLPLDFLWWELLNRFG